jgi:rhodanese-related sulfurtransferase
MKVGRIGRIAKEAVYGPLRWAIARVVGARHCREPLADVRAAVEAGRAVMLDVREQSEWDRGHLRGAVPVPLSVLRGRPPAEWTPRLPAGRPVYVHCGAGGRSLIAAPVLAAQGYDARPLRPGFDDLVRAGFPAGE